MIMKSFKKNSRKIKKLSWVTTLQLQKCYRDSIIVLIKLSFKNSYRLQTRPYIFRLQTKRINIMSPWRQFNTSVMQKKYESSNAQDTDSMAQVTPIMMNSRRYKQNLKSNNSFIAKLFSKHFILKILPIFISIQIMSLSIGPSHSCHFFLNFIYSECSN